MNTMLYKDSIKMLLKNAVLFTASIASLGFAAQDSVVQQQKDLLDKLTDLKSRNMGFSIEGTAKSGYRNSSLSSDSLSDISPSSENEAFSEVDLVLSARPSVESRARVDLRIHQDWQKAHEQGVNPILIHWWSYDGIALNKKMAFNLGDMRVAYTPMTIAVPGSTILMEPEIFRVRRLEAMSYRNLDGSDRRLMEGLNVDYHSGKISVLDDLRAQATVSRLRNNPKKVDQVFFDFDREDRFLLGGRGGIGAYGADVGVNYVTVFDRRKSARSFDLPVGDTTLFDDNSVLSVQLGFDSKPQIDLGSTHFGLGLEYAMSTWQQSRDIGIVDTTAKVQSVIRGTYINSQGLKDSSVYVVMRPAGNVYIRQKEEDDAVNGKGMLASLNAGTELSQLELALKMNYLNNDEKFWSELASSPSFKGNTPVLNSDAIFKSGITSPVMDMVRSGSLENTYFTVYQSLPLSGHNMMGKSSNPGVQDPSEALYYELYNNYKMAHYYRNGYSNQTFTKSEMMSFITQFDPSTNLALPFGMATPDRSGFDLNLSGVFQDALRMTFVFGSYKAKQLDTDYSKMGVGVSADVAHYIGWSKAIDVSGSYESTTESDYLKRKSSRIMAGTKVGIWRGISLLAGFQSLEKDMNLPISVDLATGAVATLKSTKETMLLAGPQIDITKGAVFTMQYGLINNEIQTQIGTASTNSLKIDKSLLMADVSVKF